MPGFKGHAPRSRQRRRRTGKRLLALLLGSLCAVVWYANVVEIPQPLVTRLIGLADESDYHIRVGRARLLGVHGIQCDAVRLYRRGVVGEPGITVGHATARLARPVRAGLSPFVLQVTDVIVVPSQCRRPPQQSPRVATRQGVVRRHRLGMHNLQIAGVTIEALSTVLQVGGGVVVLDDLAATLSHAGEQGALSGSCRIDQVDHRISAELSTSTNPQVLLPWTDGLGWRGFSGLIRRFSLADASPLIKASFVHRRDQRTFDLNARVLLRDFAYRGVPAQRGECDVGVSMSPDHFNVTVGELYLVRPEGVARAEISFQPRARRLELDVISGFDIQALSQVANVMTNLVGSRLVFEGAAECRARGVVVVGGAPGSDLSAHIETERATVWGFQTGAGALDIHYGGETATVTNAVAAFCGGTLELGLSAHQLEEHPGWRTQLGLRIREAELADYMGQRGGHADEGPQGRLAATLELDLLARKGQPLERQGHGSIRIEDGHIFRLPVFGGLTAKLAKYVPGVDFLLRQEELAVDFTVAEGRAHSDAIKIGGDVFSFSASGDYYLDGRLHYDGQIQLFKGHTLVGKVAKIFVLPISKLFEFELRGTVADPLWRLGNFSRDDELPSPVPTAD
jgi:hypothetical protein